MTCSQRERETNDHELSGSAREDDAECRGRSGHQRYRDGPGLKRAEEFADCHLAVLIQIGLTVEPCKKIVCLRRLLRFSA